MKAFVIAGIIALTALLVFGSLFAVNAFAVEKNITTPASCGCPSNCSCDCGGQCNESKECGCLSGSGCNAQTNESCGCSKQS